MTSTIVDDTRRALGPLGVFLPVALTETPSVARQVEAARRLEAAGFRAVWVNDPVAGKDTMAQLAVLLGATERVVLGTGIANVWSRAPQVTHGGAAFLAEAYPGRLVLGLGVGHPEQAAAVGRDFGRPLAAMRDYLGRMDTPTVPPARDAPYARILAANGEKMLALAGELTDGALPVGGPPASTEDARRLLGPDRLLVVGLVVAVDPDRAADSYPDAPVPPVDRQAIASTVQAHRDAGADHVVLLPRTGTDLLADVAHLERLAPELTGVA